MTGIIAVFLVGSVGPGTGHADGARLAGPLCDDTWHVESHPQDGQVLAAVASRWKMGAWAVGSVRDPSTGAWRTYIEHWHGDAWKHVPSPNLSRGDNRLLGVWGIGADIWAVGSYKVQAGVGASFQSPLFMHYDGFSWSPVAGDPSADRGRMTDVYQTAGGEVWAVGRTGGSNSAPLIERWNGSQWSAVTVEDPSAKADGLEGVTDGGNGTLWAAGSAAGGAETLLLRWDGGWQRVASPNPGPTSNVLADVTTPRTAGYPAVAIGSYDPPVNEARARTLALQWSGDSWDQTTTPNPAPYRDVLLGVDRGPHNLQKVWAAGYRQGSPSGDRRPLIVRLSETGWQIDPAPNPYPDGWTVLKDVAVFGVPTFDSVGAVAVGNSYDATTGQSSATIMRRCSP